MFDKPTLLYRSHFCLRQLCFLRCADFALLGYLHIRSDVFAAHWLQATGPASTPLVSCHVVSMFASPDIGPQLALASSSGDLTLLNPPRVGDGTDSPAGNDPAAARTARPAYPFVLDQLGMLVRYRFSP